MYLVVLDSTVLTITLTLYNYEALSFGITSPAQSRIRPLDPQHFPWRQSRTRCAHWEGRLERSWILCIMPHTTQNFGVCTNVITVAANTLALELVDLPAHASLVCALLIPGEYNYPTTLGAVTCDPSRYLCLFHACVITFPANPGGSLA